VQWGVMAMASLPALYFDQFFDISGFLLDKCPSLQGFISIQDQNVVRTKADSASRIGWLLHGAVVIHQSIQHVVFVVAGMGDCLKVEALRSNGDSFIRFIR